MTDKQRDTGRLITLIILISILLIGVLSSCSSMLYNNNRVMVTHVLALTEMGDTVKIRIQDIQLESTPISNILISIINVISLPVSLCLSVMSKV